MVVFTDSVVPGSVGEWSAYRSRRCEDPGSILKDAALVAAVAILLRTSCSAVARSRSWVGTGAGAAPRTPYVKGVRRSSGGGGGGARRRGSICDGTECTPNKQTNHLHYNRQTRVNARAGRRSGLVTGRG